MLNRDQLLARYVEDAGNLHAIDSAPGLPDVGQRAIALYGAQDAACELRDRFGVDVLGHAAVKQ